MTSRLRWRTAKDQGALALATGPTSVVFAEGCCDRVEHLAPQADGLEIEPAEGALWLVTAHGRLKIKTSRSLLQRAKLPAGRAFTLCDAEGHARLQLQIEAAEESRPTETASDPLVGREIGGYRLLDRVGSGAVGVVYRALQLTLNREVALKILRPDKADNPVVVASFQREAQAAGRLSHPHIVQVHDVGDDQGFHFYSMELVADGTLEEAIGEAPLPLDEALLAVRECALALDFAAEHELIHRDIKPENLMRLASGHIKLADLGLAATRAMLEEESAGGTPHFMAPEVIRHEVADARADLYSLGCTLYRLVSSATPFQGERVRDILRAHLQEPAPTFADAGIDAPADAEELLARLLAKDPHDRFPSAAALVEAIDALESPTRRSLPVLIAIPLLLALAGSLFFLLPREDPMTEPEVVYVSDPESDLLAQKNRELQARLELQNLAALDPDEKLATLRAFVETWDGTEAAETAAAQRDALAERLEHAARERASLEAELASSLRKLEASIEDALQADRPAQALGILEGAQPQFAARLSAVAERVDAVLQSSLAQLEERLQAGIDAQDWPAARAACASAKEQLLGPSSRDEEFRAVLSSASERIVHAEEASHRAGLAAARARLNAALFEASHRALRFDLGPATAPVHAAIADLPDPAMQEAVQPLLALWETAAGACAAHRAACSVAEQVTVNDPKTGHRAVVLGLDENGPIISLSIRGERLELRSAWEPFLAPEHLGPLLRVTLSGHDRQSRLALQLLVSEYRIAPILRAALASSDRGTRGRALLSVRRLLDSLPPEVAFDPLTADEFLAIEQVAGTLQALNDGDDLLAWQLSDAILRKPTLLALLLGDGSTAWEVAQ